MEVRFEPDGHLRLLAIVFGPDQVHAIDKIKDVSRRAAEVGGVGDALSMDRRQVSGWKGEAGLWKPRWFPEIDLK